jgi:hypothetical protein
MINTYSLVSFLFNSFFVDINRAVDLLDALQKSKFYKIKETK